MDETRIHVFVAWSFPTRHIERINQRINENIDFPVFLSFRKTETNWLNSKLSSSSFLSPFHFVQISFGRDQFGKWVGPPSGSVSSITRGKILFRWPIINRSNSDSVGELLEVQVSSSIFVDCVSLHAAHQALTVKENLVHAVFSRETRENGVENRDVSNNSRTRVTPTAIYRSQSVPPDLAAFRKRRPSRHHLSNLFFPTNHSNITEYSLIHPHAIGTRLSM